MAKITVQKALNELSIIDSRISKKIKELSAVGSRKNSEKLVFETRQSVDEFMETEKSIMQSVDDLLKRKRDLKKAVMISNANTIIVVGGIEYTVMEAIERKRNIDDDKQLVTYLKQKFASVERSVERKNDDVENYIERQSLAMSGGSSEKKTESVLLFEKTYRKDYSWDIIDPLDIKNEISKREELIQNFELDIDTEITVSNSTTFIEV